MTAIISQRNEQIERSIADFTQEFQALLEKYDMYVVSYTLYDGHDESCGEGSYLTIGREQRDMLGLDDIVQPERLIDKH